MSTLSLTRRFLIRTCKKTLNNNNNSNKLRTASPVINLNQLNLKKNYSTVILLNNKISNLLNHQERVQNKNVFNTNKRGYSHVPYTKEMIEQRVLLVLRLCDKINPGKVNLDSHFYKDLSLDSLDHVDIIIAMEDEFGFEIPDCDMDFLTTPRLVVQYVCDKFDVFH